MRVNAYAATAPGAHLTPYEYDTGELGPLEVDVEVTHCGICHTDLMVIDNDWGSGVPTVAGHEVAGVVTAVGNLVDTDRLTVGQRVVVGGVAGSCMCCRYCLTGRQQLCARRDSTAFRGDRGGFASSVRASDWRFVFPLPDSIASEHAGPMLCAGVTVFAPFVRHRILPTDHVAVVGIGGLGHLALQFAHAWGCEVTAVSTSPGKREQALDLGADHFIATTDSDELRQTTDTFDHIICTVPADLPWDEYLCTLKPQGMLIVIGASERTMHINPLSLVFSEKAVSGGLVASPDETRQMLEFAARTGVRPVVETFDMSDINAAITRVRSGDVRFRAVLATR